MIIQIIPSIYDDCWCAHFPWPSQNTLQLRLILTYDVISFIRLVSLFKFNKWYLHWLLLWGFILDNIYWYQGEYMQGFYWITGMVAIIINRTVNVFFVPDNNTGQSRETWLRWANGATTSVTKTGHPLSGFSAAPIIVWYFATLTVGM